MTELITERAGAAGQVRAGADRDAALPEPLARTPQPNEPAEWISGWGRHPWSRARLEVSEDLSRGSVGAHLSRGLGRAYGDAALPAAVEDRLLHTPLADRILDFDPASGLLRAEAGLTLGELYRLFVPRGWFTPVSPGTRHVTLGGMVASDIHGKNHHVAGTFGRHLRSLVMRVGDGRVLRCSRQDHADLFFATQGGMGLTGHILEVEVALERIASPWIYEESERLPNLEAVFGALREASAHWPMTVAWIDTSARGGKMGRGIVMRGRWATPDEAPTREPKMQASVAVPFDWPSGLVNPTTISWMNRLFYFKHFAKRKQHVVDPQAYFWILDSVNEWNRVFGRRGFTQYQCVLPSEVEVFRSFLERFQRLGACSFVTVLKDCGAEGEGHLSFPKQGSTIAVDIPIRDARAAAEMTARFNEFVLEHGGRVYLTKDAFTTPEHLAQMYPRLDEWRTVCRRYDSEGRLRSALSVRLGLS